MTTIPHTCSRPFRAALAAIIASLAVGACSPSKVGDGVQFPTQPQAGTLNIQVTRDDTRIALTNTTARDLPASRLWVNGQFSRPLEPLSIGESVNLSLHDFVNEFGERFRAGGFFATEPPRRIVRVSMELPEGVYGLIIVGDRTP